MKYIIEYNCKDIDQDLRNVLIKDVTEKFEQDAKADLYGEFNEGNKNSLCYMPDYKKFVKDNGQSAGVKVFRVSDESTKLLHSYYRDDPVLSKTEFDFNVLVGGSYIFPHIDSKLSDSRDHVLQCLLIEGLPNITTQFYQPKPDLKNKSIESDTGIPYYSLDYQKEYHFKENIWYRFKSGQIHGVKRLGDFRAFIMARTTVSHKTFEF